MKVQNYMFVASLAQLSAAARWGVPLERRQRGDGATPDNFASMMDASDTGLSGVLSGYSVASMFVTAMNCQFLYRISRLFSKS